MQLENRAENVQNSAAAEELQYFLVFFTVVKYLTSLQKSFLLVPSLR